MGAYTLRLCEDHLEPRAGLALATISHVVYVLAGDVIVTTGNRNLSIATDCAWHSTEGESLTAGRNGATLLRYELLGAKNPAAGARTVLAQAMDLDDAGQYLIRCDRVDFAPGGEALPHGHKGGGIRRLIAGELDVRVGGAPGRVMKPGDAWFESGIEPVHAIASATTPTSFIRVSILPRAIRGQSSIVYVDPAHAAVKPRKYAVFVDDPIPLP